MSPASGNNQMIFAGAIMTGPLVVRVADAGFHGKPNVPVTWTATGISGTFHSVDGAQLAEPVTRTDQFGYARVRLRPDTTFGTGEVRATAAGAVGAPAVFTLTVIHHDDVFVNFGPFFDCNEESVFGSASAQGRFAVRLGGTVQWKYADTWLHHSCRAVLRSIETPPGGASFTSDSLAPTGTFRFKPNVTGTWVFADVVNGGRGTLIVTP